MRRIMLVAVAVLWGCGGGGVEAYRERVEVVRGTPGFVALWDFVQREDGPEGSGRFVAQTPDGPGYALEARNIIRTFWNKGREAGYDDFPLAGRGPFGQAVRFEKETEEDFLPTLLVPREALHDSRLDVKGAGSVSMVVWTLFEDGGHVLAGIWHEGTDITSKEDQAAVVQKGRRQYASFAGLAANNGASAVHISENGQSSFTDKYARNLAVTPEIIPRVDTGGTAEGHDASWSAVGFVFDNDNDTATAYLDGKATDYWIENPQEHPFFQWPAKGWRQAQLAARPGLQEGEEEDFPPDQYYTPPEEQALEEQVVSASATERVVLQTYEFTKVRETFWIRDGKAELVDRELVALRVNPFWFGHDLYAPQTVEEGGPFTIGRVIKSSRSQGNTAFYGGVAVFDRALTTEEMERLARIADEGMLEFEDVADGVISWGQ